MTNKNLLPLAWGQRTFIMGILNITPDSFSGDGLLGSGDIPSAALKQARGYIRAGADILDIGGESTRPGSQPVTADEELERIIPVIHKLASADLDCIISVDTYKSEVAELAVQSGAHWINDIHGLQVDPTLAEVAARHKTNLILMHNRSNPARVETGQNLGGHYTGAEYQDLIIDIRNDLMNSVSVARSAGVEDEYLILDPGLGFGKSVIQNLEIINRLDEIRSLGFPVLLGPSRKSFIGYTLNLPVDERLEGTEAAVAVGIVRGADIIRVHDVEPVVRIARMVDAILRSSSF